MHFVKLHTKEHVQHGFVTYAKAPVARTHAGSFYAVIPTVHRPAQANAMPRFSIRSLMLAITLVAVGLSVEIVLFKYSRALWLTPQIEFVLFVTGAGMIGGGLAAHPIERRWHNDRSEHRISANCNCA